MKQHFVKLLWILGIVTSSMVNAKCSGVSPLFSNACYDLWGWCDRITPGVGIDFKGVHLSGKQDWKHQFRKYYAAGNAYFVARFHEYFSLELGYEQSARRSRSPAFKQGQLFFGNDLSGFAYQRNTKISLPHADLNYLLCLTDNLDFLASIGVGDMVVKTQQTVIQPSNSAVAAAVLNMQFRHTAVFRARLGLQYLLSPCLGVRALAGFDNSGHIHVRGGSEDFFKNHQIVYRPFAEAVSGSVGFFIQF